MSRLWGKSRGCRQLQMCFQYIYLHFGEKPIRVIRADIACGDVKLHIDILIPCSGFEGQICHHENAPLFAALARKSHINWLVAGRKRFEIVMTRLFWRSTAAPTKKLQYTTSILKFEHRSPSGFRIWNILSRDSSKSDVLNGFDVMPCVLRKLDHVKCSFCSILKLCV